MSALDAPPSAPLFDTWGPSRSVAAWCIDPARGAEQPGNEWTADALATSLDSLAPVARAWRVAIAAAGDGGSSMLEWTPGQEPAGFAARAAEAVRGFPAPVYSVEAELDLYAWSRLLDSPHTPAQAWLRLPTTLRIWGGEPTHRALCLSMDHTLYRGHAADGRDNRDLHRLNAPALEGALRRWEERLGPIAEVDGQRGVYRYGFTDTVDS